jgi:RNA polymerase sigma factor (sigma-70 family)
VTKDELAERHIALVHYLVRRHPVAGYEYEDAVGEAFCGLAEAIQRYDPNRGCAFTTLAVPIIIGKLAKLGRLKKAIKRQGIEVHLDDPRGGEDSLTIGETLSANCDPEDEAIKRSYLERMHEAFAGLSEREKIVATHIAGIYTQDRAAAIAGISQAQVHRLVQKTLIRLRELMGLQKRNI